MSRPTSFYDQQDQPYHHQSNGFQLPLFSHQAPSAPPIIQSNMDSLPAPATSGGAHGQQRHSISFPQPTIGSNPPLSAGAIPPPNTRPGNHAAAYYHQQRNEELAPPSSSSGLGSLARSASLGARKKDPYAYASDDVESGLGNMDMADTHAAGGSSGWGGSHNGNNGGGHGGPGTGGGMYASPMRDVSMSAAPPPQSARSFQSNMNPPPIPSHLSRPPQSQIRTDSISPSKSSPVNYGGSIMPNPYVPRTSESGPSASSNTQWADYRPPNTQRLGSGASMRSPMTDPMSPYSHPDIGSNSPMMNPYEGASPVMGGSGYDTSLHRSQGNQLPTSPLQPPSQWGTTYAPPSPHRPPTNTRSHSQQLYSSGLPTSAPNLLQQDTTMRGGSSRGNSMRGTPRQGFRDVENASDLKPIINTHSNGRRADPRMPGKYLGPLKCLTSDLAQTYTLCNPQYRYEASDNPRRVLTKPSKPVHNDGADNEDWDYILYVNDVLGGEDGGDRYLILDVLGQGTFGQVVKCQNMRTHELFAVKVVKNKPAYLNQSKMEVAILELLNNTHDPRDEYHILRMHDSFTHKNHLCLVFECLSSNLYELIKQNQFKGLSTQLVKVFTQQLLECLAVLKDARLIHCDLKPENILLKSLQSPQIKVIDFGSACHEMQTVYTYIQSRFYRSPEVLLGLPYSTSIDMWSLGCIMVELFLGLPLFPGTSEYNQVSRITEMLGNPPNHLLEVGKQTHEFFNIHNVGGRKQFTLKSMEQYAVQHRTNETPSKQYFKQTQLKDIIMEYPFSKKNAKQSDIDKEMAQRTAFLDFVQGLLNLDPIRRWSPQQAAKHPFITGEPFTGPFQPSATTSKRTAFPAAPTPESPSRDPSKKYGGIAQSPTAAPRGQRVQSDAGAYSQQMGPQASYNAPSQSAHSTPRQIYTQGYDQHPQTVSQPVYGQGPHHRVLSNQQPPPQPNWGVARQGGSMAPPTPNQYQPRIPSNTIQSSGSHTTMRSNTHMVPPPTNPPPNSYYPQSRNRANTINQMDAIPPALARLTHFGAPDPSGQRNLTPVLNRDDAMREWERRQAGGHSKQSSMHNASYPQLEYLQEQAELAAMSGQGWMMPGQYGHVPPLPPVSHAHGHVSGHRHQNSASYQMQPHINLTPHSPTTSSYRYDIPPHTSVPTTPGYLPAFPPPAATGSGGSGFDAFEARDPSMGMMYTPLQPNQAYHGVGGGGHQARASFSGPYHNGHPQGSAGSAAPGSNNPFGGNGQHQQQQQQHQQQQGQSSPRYQRRSQGYGGA